jgi:hypothetical protein
MGSFHKLILFLFLLVAGAFSCNQVKEKREKRNIVFIFIDDLIKWQEEIGAPIPREINPEYVGKVKGK